MIRSPSGGSISSGSTNNSGITKSTLNTNTINNPNSFSKTSTKDKDKTNSGRKGVTPSEGLDSQGWVVLTDEYFDAEYLVNDFQEDEGVLLLGRIHWVPMIRVDW